MSIHRKSRRPGQVRPARTSFNAAVEAFEKRELLTTVAPFIQGTAFVDSSATGTLTPTDTPLANATISLYQGAASTLTANSPVYETTTTKSDGGYVFNTGLTVGATYTVVESAAGYTSTGAQAVSQIDPASVIAPNEIQVTVVDPNAVTATFTGPVTPFNNIYYTLGTTNSSTVPTQLTFELGGASNVVTSPFSSMCVGLNDPLSSTTYGSVIDPQSALTSNGGEIAYLYNQYGVTLPNAASLPAGLQNLPTKDLISGVQLAIWSLEYGSSFSVTGYDPTYTTATDYTDIQTATAGFLSDAQGKSEKVAIIDASLTGSLPAASATVGGQSVLAGESLNFGNKLSPPTGSIGGTVYVDNNANDTLDTGETGLGGITVSLENSSGVVLATTTTSSTGTYSFNGLVAGSYVIQEGSTSGYIRENANPGTSGGTASVGAITGINLTSGTNDTGNNFGQYQPVTIAGTVYNDNNGNDVFDSGDTGVGGNNVYLYNSTGTTQLAVTTTAGNGSYSFTTTSSGQPLTPGSYIVSEFPSPGTIGENPTAGSSGGTPTFNTTTTLSLISTTSLTSGTNDVGNNFGQYQTGTISGLAYVDATNSGSYVSGETTISGITVSLVNSGGTTIATTTTGNGGTYSFSGVVPGTYKVVESNVPTGYSPDKTNTGSLPVTITSGSTSANNNFGEIGATSISGTVYVDATGQGLTPANQPAGPGDTVEAGVTVNLDNASGKLIATTTTASNGTYSFTGLPAGTYGIAESVPSGTYQTGPAALTYSVTTSSSAPNSTNDNFSNYMACNMSGLNAYYFTITTPSGSSTNVSNLGGNVAEGDTVTAYFSIAPGSAPVMLSLVAYQAPTSYYSPSNVSQQVITSVATGTYGPGNYSETVTVPNSYFQVDFVCGAAIAQLELNGAPTDYNYENRLISAANGGNQTYALSSLSGTVYADNNGNDTLDSGDTGIGGVQVFLYNAAGTQRLATTTTASNGTYSFGNLTPATYVVAEFTPSGYNAENPNPGSIGGSASFSASSSLEVLGAINLNSNTNATNYNFGGVPPFSTISGTVYADNNGNDTLDSGDTGIGGVQVFLYNAAGTQRLATTTTASNGTYSFGNLTPATYVVAEFTPSGYNAENPNPGSIGGSASFSTSSSLEVLGAINLNSNTNATNYNFGGVPPFSTISGTVYADANRNDTLDSGDTGIGGVQVFLYNAAGTQRLATTTTASNGTYSFGNLTPATYVVAEFAPSGDTVENPNAGISGGSVSSSTSSSLAVINSISLGSGVSDTGNNFGNLPPLATATSLCGIVYADLNYNDVYNCGIDYGIAGVTVTLSGKTSYGANYSLTTTTDCYGNYCFTNVVTGNYTITETEPGGYTPEASNIGNAGGIIGLGSTSGVNLTAGAVDTGYNFGSKVNTCSLGNYQTCSTNYWCGSSGQSLLKCLNGGSNATKLGSWLASLLPNICGSYAGMTNSQVCSSFQSLSWSNSCNANIVSTALAAYCTNTSLAGCSTASNYGFSLANCGGGNCTVSVGNTFANYGGPCGTASLYQLLSFADSQSTSWSGWNFGSSQSSISSCFSSINACSKIG